MLCPPPPAAWAFAVLIRKSIGLHSFLSWTPRKGGVVYSSPSPNLTRDASGDRGVELRGVGFESARFDRGANLPHQPLVEIQIMNGVQVGAQYLVASVQMPQIAAAEVSAGITGASRLEGTCVLLMSRIANIDDAGAGEKMGVACVAGGHDAIEHIDAAAHRLDDVLRSSDAHEIARFARGHVRHQRIEHEGAFGFALSHREAADGEARKADLLERCQRREPQ